MSFAMPYSLIRRYLDQGAMIITPFEAENLIDTAYYFRLGADAYDVDTRAEISVRRKGSLKIDPGQSFAVESYESFRFPYHVRAMIGHPTSLPLTSRLVLFHGPTIDGGYGLNPSDPNGSSRIELVLHNFSTTVTQIPHMATIGKLLFEDMTDSAQEHRTGLEMARDREARLRQEFGTSDENPDGKYQADYE